MAHIFEKFQLSDDILDNHTVSKFERHTGLILTVCLVCFFLLRHYLLEPYLVPQFYGKFFRVLGKESSAVKELEGVKLRSFINHHLSVLAKIALLLWTVYPFCNLTWGNAGFNTPLHKGSVVTHGDVLIVSLQAFVAMYLAEIHYRTNISLISAAHHMGTVIVAQSAVMLCLKEQNDAIIELILCFVWGFFDVIAESWPHVTIILYRLYPDQHGFLAKIFFIAFLSSALGSVVETAVIMYLFGSLWAHWSLAFKISTPISHLVFTTAQCWGSYILWDFWRKYHRLARGVAGGETELEEGKETGAKNESENSSQVVMEARAPAG